MDFLALLVSNQKIVISLGDPGFYQNHLNRVSRSFAFCIAELAPPLRDWVSLAYLLCRVADTLEDAPWKQKDEQLKTLRNMKDFIAKSPSDRELEVWRRQIPTAIPQSEILLLQDAAQLFRGLAELPEPAKGAMRRSIGSMIEGMKYFSAQKDASSQLRTDFGIEQYCFFVAGIVGELLTELVTLTTQQFVPSATTWEDSVHFGLFLQKVNILKDQQKDEREGRVFIFAREVFLKSLGGHAAKGFRYLQQIPAERRDYRLFCAWSLFLGRLSLPHIEKSWSEKSERKISKLETAAMVAQVRIKIDSNEALAHLWSEMPTLLAEPGLGKQDSRIDAGAITKPDLSEATKSASVSNIPRWFSEIYHGRLEGSQLQALGIIA